VILRPPADADALILDAVYVDFGDVKEIIVIGVLSLRTNGSLNLENKYEIDVASFDLKSVWFVYNLIQNPDRMMMIECGDDTTRIEL
jgi:hypothetical protein